MTEQAHNLTSVSNTVFALSTPVGGAIAVIRASGPLSREVLGEIFTGRICERVMSFGRLTDGESVIDECMAVFFKGPRSYTGEDMFELSLHGSYAVVSAAFTLLLKKGLLLAAAGEFTKRAFLNGRMDLVQADAVMDLINAETELSRNAALDQLRGGLSARIGRIEEKLLDAASELGAALDYPEEMEDEVMSALPDTLGPVIKELDALVRSGKSGRIIRDGAKLVILGRPNAGKSSLLNALLNEERAIVTEYAGTTRDVLEERFSLAGIPVRLVDTAGLRSNAGPVESIGIDRAEKQAETADCILLVFDGTRELDGDDIALIEKTRETPVIFIVNKCDLAPEKSARTAEELKALRPAPSAVISCRTREGLDALTEAAAKALGSFEGGAIVTNERHVLLLESAENSLRAAVERPAAGLFTELALEHVSQALASLAGITGRVFSEDLLDRIFSRFCVGK